MPLREKNNIMEQLTALTEIANDTLEGLSATPKYLLPKYFYDDTGSSIFQDIMQMPEYYLTDCEFEIFDKYKAQITDAFRRGIFNFDLVEFGSGDGLKTKILLNYLTDKSVDFKYIPIDISAKANDELVSQLKAEIPTLNIEPKTGDYFHLMKKTINSSETRKVILFLGANIGNFRQEEISLFLSNLSDFTRKGDKVLIGFDLKKSPSVIIKAYNDPHGHTRNFNLNHLVRINNELDADFNPDNFEQHTEYNPLTGEVKSFLISKIEQTVCIGSIEKSFRFKRWEPIFMELSRKFDPETIHDLAVKYGFKVEQNFTDHRNYFVDSLWVRE